jgi:hypothetical protein
MHPHTDVKSLQPKNHRRRHVKGTLDDAWLDLPQSANGFGFLNEHSLLIRNIWQWSRKRVKFTHSYISEILTPPAR